MDLRTINWTVSYFVFQAVADAERQKAVLEITIQERIIEKEGAKNVSLINNEIKKAAENNEADIAKYKLEKVKNSIKIFRFIIFIWLTHNALFLSKG